MEHEYLLRESCILKILLQPEKNFALLSQNFQRQFGRLSSQRSLRHKICIEGLNLQIYIQAVQNTQNAENNNSLQISCEFTEEANTIKDKFLEYAVRLINRSNLHG
eukprot:TRINITY_DN67103_c0_g1_i1.p3 TRINITY_DN67103_c0_g1~~TRINITY_DN67103_c0_g1_i1.p3  ORF type:complete len:106 (+),score=0.64 TRINITY_DN67103_c0_g1_i1:97-414(+)